METREIKTEVVRNGDQQGEVGRDQPGKRTVVAQVGNRSKVQGTVREGLRKDVRAYQQYQTKATKRGAQYGTTVTIDSSDTWTHKNLAYTDKSGGVHISNAISTDDFTEALEHEMNHVMKRKGYQPYLAFAERVPEAANYSSNAGNRLLSGVAEHRGIDLSKPLTEKDVKTISDEIAALVRGAEKSGRAQEVIGDLREAFDDYDAFASELAKIHEQYVKDVAEEKRREESKS